MNQAQELEIKLLANRKIVFRNFGTLSLIKRKKRKNALVGDLPERYSIKFKPARNLLNKVKKLSTD